MRTTALTSLAMLCAVLGGAKAGHAEATSASAVDSDRPHVVILLADDLGWKDVGYHGSEIRTPNIDRIAAAGVELDRFYVQPTCSPTRAGLMTGKSPMRLGINRPLGKNDAGGLDLDETILPELLAEAGYQPLMVGKWHLGNAHPDYWPQARGFEHFYGYLSGGIGYWDHNHGGGHDWQRNGETVREEGYSTRLLADEAVRVLRARDPSRPTFLYVALPAPHLPNEAPEETIATYASIPDEKRRVHAAMVTELDSAIGRVLATLEEEGMLRNSIVLFSSDNGGLSPGSAPPPFVALSDLALRFFDRPVPFAGVEFIVSNVLDGASDNAPLPEGKGSVAEGGARVPAAIWWPGRLSSGRHDAFMTISDVLPTLLEAIGETARIPDDLNGASQWGALSGTAPSVTPDYVISGYQGMALYRAPWKFVPGEVPKLYDVFADPLETRNRAGAHPDRVATLSEVAEAWPKRVRDEETSVFGLLWDPDTFGGPEDREPWADVARRRADGDD